MRIWILGLLLLAGSASAQGYELDRMTDEEGRIYLTDRDGNRWRCFLTGNQPLPLHCRHAERQSDDPESQDTESEKAMTGENRLYAL